MSQKIGEILIDKNLITREQLQEALELQKLFPGQTIGQLLYRLGHLKESDLFYVLEQSGKRQRLSDILTDKKLIDAERLEQAMVFSRKENIPLYRAILKLSLLDETVLGKEIASQYDLAFVHIDSLMLDHTLARCINATYAAKQHIVPISRIGKTLTLAMSYPLKIQELKGLEASVRLRIIQVIAPDSEVIRGQQRLYKTATPHEVKREEITDLEISPDSIMDMLSISGLDEPEVDEEVRKVTEKDSIIVKLVNKIIYDAFQNNASDIHIEPYPGRGDVIIRIRVDGQCRLYQKIPYKYKYAIPSRIKIMASLDIAERRRPQDGKITFNKFGPLDIELRVATMPTSGQLEDVVLRILANREPIPFENIGLTDRNMTVFEQAIRKPYGMVLVVGPTGSGKTTTLHSAVGRINTPDMKIWTAEDPVEITQRGLRQVQVNSRIGLTFAAVLRSFLRLDPDVILVGEIRDAETATIAIEASLTGHLVFSTLHTNTAPETITRLLEMGMDPFSFSDSLLCIIGQRLVRTLCQDCRTVYKPSAAEIDEIIEEYGREDFALTGLDPAEITVGQPVGCFKCNNSGYRGRCGIFEVLESSDIVRSFIKRKAQTDQIRQQAVAEGMTTLRQDGILKVFKGLTDLQEVRRVCLK